MSLIKTKFLYVAKRHLATSLVRNGYWNKDWRPAPYPKTQEERLAAAKKYGLLPIEYEPTPDDGYGSGDYPHLEPVSAEAKDPFYPWDYPDYRTNYGEVLHEDFNIYGEDRININQKNRFSMTTMLACFFSVLGLTYLGVEYGGNTCFMPMARPHMPAPGVKHYTYEPASYI